MQFDANVAEKSPFLLRQFLLQASADSDAADLEPLDASRGAPNWQQRRVLNAWHALGLYAAASSDSPDGEPGIALALDPDEAHLDRFRRFATQHQTSPGVADGCALLERVWEWLAADALAGQPVDRIVYQFAEAMAGRLYPNPPTLDFVQPIISRYLAPLLFGGDQKLAGDFRVSVCEGATTGIAQVTSTLARNGALRRGDKIAMLWPTYEPLRDQVECQLGCEVVPVRRDASADWTIPAAEFDKLLDPAVRLVVVVSPGNPVPTVTDPAGLDALEAAVARRPDLLILADYVYTHFLDAPVETEIARMPRNTIGVYSVSKDFGLAGARLGVVLMHEDCVAEEALAALAEPEREQAAGRYRRRSMDPSEMPLLDRMIADSRGVSFNHMSGVSTPLQVLACLCAAYDLVDPDAPRYFAWVGERLRERVEALYDGLGLATPPWNYGPSSRYSTVIDLLDVARARGGDEMAESLAEGEIWPFMEYLARTRKLVLTVGEGFGLGKWTVRACFPSVSMPQSREMGRRLADAVEEYAGQ